MSSSDAAERGSDGRAEGVGATVTNTVALPAEAKRKLEGHIVALMNPYIANDGDDESVGEGSIYEDVVIEEGFVDEDAGIGEGFDDEISACSDEHAGQMDDAVFRSQQKDTKVIDCGGEKEEGSAATKKNNKSPLSVLRTGVKLLKDLYSTGLLIFSLILVFVAMFTHQTTMARDVHPSFAFFFFWFLISWLATMEGGQGCVVGLQPISKSLYEMTHHITHKNTNLAHRGDNLERFIVGRQFLVVLVVFLINMCGAPIEGATVLNMPDVINDIFLNSGVALIFSTIILGQLTPQINAAVCMLDFINNYFMLFTTYVSFGIEASGLLHSVYLVQIVFSTIIRKPIESKEAPRNVPQAIFFWGRVILSCAIIAFSLAVTLKALFDGNSGIWENVPPAAGIVIFFALLCVVGMMEGTQIAAFALRNVPEEELSRCAPVASANCSLIFHGMKLRSFLIGRQIFVATCMFVVARIAAVNMPEGSDNIFGVSDGFQNFINTGLLGAVVLTIMGSLVWRVVASLFPFAFMSNPVIFFIIHACLFLEQTGLCSAARLLALVQERIAGFRLDEDYIGAKEEREVVAEGGAVDDGKLKEAPTFEVVDLEAGE